MSELSTSQPARGSQSGSQTATAATRFVALYLPQFHPIAENDEWWGTGFTEWTNVARAKPLFRGHAQPRIPGELGFYDLRLAETRQAQATLARASGIDAFCYYHYWFSGKRLLERPFDEVLASGEPELPFCLCWANESWSRRWLGEEREVLQQQTYSAQDDAEHGRWLAAAFADARYVRVHGRPLFLIYRPMHLPEPLAITDRLREQAVRLGVAEPYLVAVDAHSLGADFRGNGFDDVLHFMPALGTLPDAFKDGPHPRRALRNASLGVVSSRLRLYDYRDAMRRSLAAIPKGPHIPSVFVGWDNTPRRGRNGIVMCNDAPEHFGEALQRAAEQVQSRAEGERLVFINAWNEWAEGNHLEPDLARGDAHLRQVLRVKALLEARAR